MPELLGSTEPRVYTPPLRELTPETSLGFALVDFATDVLEIKLLPWEKWLFVHGLEVLPSGLFRFRIVITIVGRQNGKTMMSQVLAAFFLWVLYAKIVLGTSLSLDQAEEVWEGVVDMALNNDDLNADVERVARSNGQKALKLTGGRRYKVAATSGTADSKGGRGKSVDLLLLDEIREHKNWKAWGSTTKTTLARPNAQVWCISNAGEEDAVVLRSLRMTAHSLVGDPDGICKDMELIPDESGIASETLGFFEWSAPPDAGKWDRQAWAAANPSLGYGFLTERALATSAATDDDAVFRTECLNQWISTQVIKPFPAGAWEAGVDDESTIADDSPISYAMDVSGDRTQTSIAVCGMREDGLWHVEVVARRTGTDWAVKWLAKRCTRGRKIRVAIQGRGAPASSYSQELSSIDGLELVKCEGADVGTATGRFYDGICAADDAGDSDAVAIMHRTQPVLDDAAETAQKKQIGDGNFAWDRVKSVKDCAPLMACTLAHWLATREQGPKVKTYRSAYAERGVLTV